jgi:hypothetical protein
MGVVSVVFAGLRRGEKAEETNHLRAVQGKARRTRAGGIADIKLANLYYICLCMFICIYVYMHVCMYVCMHVCPCVCMYYVCMYVCLYVCMYYIHSMFIHT